MIQSPHIQIIGCGYTGKWLTRKAAQSGYHVTAWARKPIEFTKSSNNIEFIQCDVENKFNDSENYLKSTLIYSIPPKNESQDSILNNFIHQLQFKRSHIIYLSTTGVYGDCNGELIDEKRTLAPRSDREKARVDAEFQWIDFCAQQQIPLTILRLAAIYGPCRLPIDKIINKEAIVQFQDAPWINRIHVEDLSNTILLAIKNPSPLRVLNICDGNPTKSTDYYKVLAKALNMPPPPEAPLEEILKTASPLMKDFLTSSKRISNQKLINDFKYEFVYKNFEDGIKASL